MRTNSFHILLTLLMMSVTLSACAKTKQSPKNGKKTEMIGAAILRYDEDDIKRLGKTAAEVIYSPDRITVYSLEPFDSIAPEGAVEVIPHYTRGVEAGRLHRDYADVLTFLLYSRQESYQNDTVKVRSPRIPYLELVYQKKKAQVSVIISKLDNTWSVKSDGKVQFVWNFQNQPLIHQWLAPLDEAIEEARKAQKTLNPNQKSKK